MFFAETLVWHTNSSKGNRLGLKEAWCGAGLRGVFMIWSLYIMGNFLAVGVPQLQHASPHPRSASAVHQVLSLFQVAPVKRRCWGFFRENSFDYKRFVGRAAHVSVVLSLSLPPSLPPSLSIYIYVYINIFMHILSLANRSWERRNIWQAFFWRDLKWYG